MKRKGLGEIEMLPEFRHLLTLIPELALLHEAAVKHTALLKERKSFKFKYILMSFI